ncbi:hypothetical protein M413DRAFT_11598 [Hebeloma cylindrosporum]|uniref:Uncharacterized protein n=1 Tax=Hebeloma cylindrosporum TaxID=76867 RepID=A0A0C3CB24_HEBCY|nr:hypothetical protein M413DRAFT_11598 [Hebeloma cylindrosporum h7]
MCCFLFKKGSHKPDNPKIDPPKGNKPSNATVAVVPLPKDTIGIVFGQRISEYSQRYNTYITDADGVVLDPQAVWDAPSESSRFKITKSVPASFIIPDPNVLSIGPFKEDRHIGIYFSHKKIGDSEYEESVAQHSTYEFKIGGENAITFTMRSRSGFPRYGSRYCRGIHDQVRHINIEASPNHYNYIGGCST